MDLWEHCPNTWLWYQKQSDRGKQRLIKTIVEIFKQPATFDMKYRKHMFKICPGDPHPRLIRAQHMGYQTTWIYTPVHTRVHLTMIISTIKNLHSNAIFPLPSEPSISRWVPWSQLSPGNPDDRAASSPDCTGAHSSWMCLIIRVQEEDDDLHEITITTRETHITKGSFTTAPQPPSKL